MKTTRNAFFNALQLASAFGHAWANSFNVVRLIVQAGRRDLEVADVAGESADWAEERLASLRESDSWAAIERVEAWIDSLDDVPETMLDDLDAIEADVCCGPKGHSFELDNVSASGRYRWEVDPESGRVMMGVCRPSAAWRRWSELRRAAEDAGPLASAAISAIAGPEPERGNEVVVGLVRYSGDRHDIAQAMRAEPYARWWPWDRRIKRVEVREDGEVWIVGVESPDSVEGRHVAAALDLVDAFQPTGLVRDDIIAAIAASCPAAVREWLAITAEDRARREAEESENLRRMAALVDAEP